MLSSELQDSDAFKFSYPPCTAFESVAAASSVGNLRRSALPPPHSLRAHASKHGLMECLLEAVHQVPQALQLGLRRTQLHICRGA